MITFKQIAIYEERDLITNLVFLGASGDAGDEIYQADLRNNTDSRQPVVPRESFISLAIVTTEHIRIYTVDTVDQTLNLSILLTLPSQTFITSAILFKAPPKNSVNFSLSREANEFPDASHIFAASSDDGFIFLWDGSNLRRHSEKAFRSRYQLQSPKRPLTPMERGLDSPISPHSPGDQTPLYPDDISVGNEEHKISPTFSALKTTFNLTGLRENNFEYDESGQRILTSGFGETDDRRMPYHKWKAHYDCVGDIICLGENGCILSTSHDGYQRCWNVDGDCLGELLLPNVTDKMLNDKRRTVPRTIWKFILEKIAVTKDHEDQARRLLDIVGARRTVSHRGGRSSPNRHRDTPSRETRDKQNQAEPGEFGDCPVSPGVEGVEVKESEADRVRALIFEDFSRPPAVRDDAPPSRVQTKEELKLLEQTRILNEAKKKKQEEVAIKRKQEVEQMRSSTNENLLETADSQLANSVSTHTFPPLSQSPGKPHGKSSKKGGSLTKLGSNSIISKSLTDLWAQPQEVYRHHYAVPGAFSRDSLSIGFRNGTFDKESIGLLRRVSSQPDKVAAYEHLHDTMFLRSSKMSTNVEVPKISELRQAEVLFGAQKDMYKNADLVLRSREKPAQIAAARAVIAQSRIDQNCFQVGSMVHVLKHGMQPLKEVGLPSDQDEKSNLFDDKDAETLMELRLLQSAHLVASTGRLPKPLDEQSMQVRLQKVKDAVDGQELVREDSRVYYFH